VPFALPKKKHPKAKKSPAKLTDINNIIQVSPYLHNLVLHGESRVDFLADQQGGYVEM
jgi:hypothetical protein